MHKFVEVKPHTLNQLVEEETTREVRTYLQTMKTKPQTPRTHRMQGSPERKFTAVNAYIGRRIDRPYSST